MLRKHYPGKKKHILFSISFLYVHHIFEQYQHIIVRFFITLSNYLVSTKLVNIGYTFILKPASKSTYLALSPAI